MAGCSALTTVFAFTPSPLVVSSTTASRSLASSQYRLHVADVGSFQQGPSSNSYDDVKHHDQPAPMPQGVHAPVWSLNSPRDLSGFLQQDDRLCIVKFHAVWCKSCKRFGLKFQGLANQKTDWIDNIDGVIKRGPLRLASIEFGANVGMCKTLGIKKLPTVHIYRGGQRLAAFSCGPAKFSMLLETLDHYLQHDNIDEQKLEKILQQGNTLIAQKQEASQQEVGSVLEELMKLDASGDLESAKSATTGKKQKSDKKSWLKILP